LSPKHRAGIALGILLLVSPAGHPQDAGLKEAGPTLQEQAPTGAPVGEESLLIGEESSDPGSGALTSAPLLSTWDFVRMLFILGGIVGAIYLLFFLLKRSQGRRVVENDLIRVLGSRNLVGNKSLHLIEVGGSVFLVGAGEGGVALISEIHDKETVDRLKLESVREAPASIRSFASVLSGLFRPTTGASGTPGARFALEAEDPVEYMKKQQERLKRM
jgi:flagellar protein FliO/FliZ